MTVSTQPFVLSDDVKKEIDRWVAKYPKGKQQSAVVEALFLAQHQNGGYLSDAAMNAVAEYLTLPPIVVYEAATFYDMFNLKPIGKHKISVCTNVSCMLRGSSDLMKAIKNRLNISSGETTIDGMWTVKEVECMAACAGAPMCQIDDKKYHEHLTAEKMVSLIDAVESEEKGSHG
jgi:NADH-quinone oxidoreductase subunit E